MNPRNLFIVLLCLLGTLWLSACSEKPANSMDVVSTEPSPSQTNMEESLPVEGIPDCPIMSSTEPDVSGKDGGVDVDLTKLSSTMIYSEVYHMMVSPQDYIGKTVKIRGQYDSSYYEETKKYYHYVIIADATACCQQGIEFIWNGEHTYPSDYPGVQAEIELVGVFSKYEELGQTYYYLRVDNLGIIPGGN